MRRMKGKGKIGMIMAVVVSAVLVAFIPNAVASVTDLTITPNTSVAGKVVAYNITLNATPAWQTLNITIPAGFEAVAPTTSDQLLAKGDVYCSDGSWCGNITIKSSSIYDPSEWVDIVAYNKSKAKEELSIKVNYSPGASIGFKAFNAGINLTLPTETKNGSLNISLPSGKQLRNVTVSLGAFVRNPTKAGLYNFTTVADGLPGDFEIVSIPTKVEINPKQGPAGSWVFINGSYFTSNSYVEIRFAGNYWTASATDANGNFSTSKEIPEKPAGTYAVNVTDLEGGKAGTIFKVTEPSVVISPERGPTGANITVNITGFVNGSSLTIQYWNGTTWKDIKTLTYAGPDNVTNVTIPEDITTTTVDTNEVNIRVIGEEGAVLPDKQPKPEAYALYTVVSPKIELEPDRGPPGVTINVTLYSFTPNTNGIIHLKNETIDDPIGGFTTNETGYAVVSVEIPEELAEGMYNITAIDATGLSATAVFNATPTPELTITPNTGPVDVTVTLKATGFYPNKNISILYLNESGEWNLSYSDTTGAGGDHTNDTWRVPKDINVSISPNIQINQTFGNTTAVAYATYNVTPTIEITPINGTVGTEVTVSGKAFGNVTVYFDGIVVNETSKHASGRNDWTGYSRKFEVPATPSGNYTVKVVDEKGLENTTTFTVLTNITLNVTSGNVGDVVAVNGTAFASEKTVEILFNGTKVAEATTDANGTFSMATFVVPHIPNGTYNVTAIDTTGRNATKTFRVLTNLTVSPEKAKVYENVTLFGTAYGANENVTIELRNATSAVKTWVVKADENGTFEKTVTIPLEIASGAYTFRATGNTTGFSDDASLEVLLTLFIKAYREKASVGLIEVNGSWPDCKVCFKVTQNGYTIPTKALIYIDDSAMTYSNETTGFFNVTLGSEWIGMHEIKAKNHTFTPPLESNIINFTVSEPELKLTANDTTVNPQDTVLFTLEDQYGYPIEGASLYEGVTNLSALLGIYTNEWGNITRQYFDTGVYEMYVKWTWKGAVKESNHINVTVKEKSVRIESEKETVRVNESVKFKLYDEWNETVNITNISVTPGTSGVNWTIDQPNATVTFLKEGSYTVNATDERGLWDTATINVSIVLGNFSVSITPSDITVNKSETVLVDVRDADTGEPVEGATVNLSGCGVEMSNETNASGIAAFEVKATSTGNITVTVSKTGYKTWMKEEGIVVKPGVPGVVSFPNCTNPPTDPDDDGLYEDINGNGRKDYDDLVEFFNYLGWVEKNEPVECFDFNGNSRIDFNDIVELYEEL